MNTTYRPTLPTASDSAAIELVCHPASPCLVPFKLEVQCTPQRLASGWAIQLIYVVIGEVHRLRLPMLKASGPAEGLWAHTCFEAFFSESAGSAYREFNFSPSTEWAHTRFITERTRDPANQEPIAPIVSPPVVESNRLVLTASVAATACDQAQAESSFSPTAVLELNDGSLSYWAMNHPAPQPDFHARAGWTLPLAWAVD